MLEGLRCIAAEENMPQVAQMYRLFCREWGSFPVWEELMDGLVVPAPILALDGSDRLLGALAFTRYAWPTPNPSQWEGLSGVHIPHRARREGLSGDRGLDN